MKTSLFISWKYQKAQQKNRLITLISNLSTISIAVGVMVLIIVLSAMNGFERELHNRILSVVPQVELTAYDDNKADLPYIQDIANLKKTLSSNKQIKATSPYINLTALIEHDDKLNMLFIKAIDTSSQAKVSNLHKFILDDGWHNFSQEKDGVILGAAIAKNLNVQVGDWVSLLFFKPSKNNKVSTTESYQVRVAGILKVEGQLDYTYALMHLQYGQQILGYSENQAMGLELNIGDPFAVQTLSFPELLHYPQQLLVNTWMSQYAHMYNDIQLIKHIMYIAMILVIGIACFNIVSTLIMAVKDKQGDIAIMRTLGAPNNFILRIFLFYGLISGMKGCIYGIVLGCLIALNLTNIILFIEYLFGVHLLSSGVYFVNFLPSELHIADVMLVLVVALLLSFVASIYPAYQAIKLQPAIILNKF